MQEGGGLLVDSSSLHTSADPVQSPDCSSKSKKRERTDQNESVSKKDQLDEEYGSPQKRECIGKFADEDGGLLNIQSVDQLILKMKQEQASSQRGKLVGIVTATSKEDCLRRFVQMGGVPILEQWIQDGFKSRSSDASLKESDKGLDEEMLMILQALEKLPIDLEALKGCSIGKSVKQLRSVRNVELQKKARKLVDTWRKRVDFEMKQSSTTCSGARGHVDSVSRSDLSSPRNIEGIELVTAVPLESTPLQDVNDALVSTPSNASTSDASPKADEKSSISSGKDASKKTTRLCSVSASTVSPAKRQKHLTALATDKDCKEEISSATDSQKRKEKDPKCENSTSKMELNSNVAGDTRKTNEYRKKLRSGGSSAGPCSTDLHANVSLSNVVQTRDIVVEKNTCIDNNTGDSEQDTKKCLATKCANAISGNETLNPPGGTVGYKEEVPTETYPQDGKADHVNESCLSSQSSCTDKRTDASPVVTFEMTNMSSHTSQLQGDTKGEPLSKHLPQKIDGTSGGLLRPSMKSTSSTDDCSGGGARKSSMSEPELKPFNTGTAVALSKRSELADTQQGAAMDGEESCCSYDNVMENGQRGSAEYPSSHATLHKDGDGAAYSESTKAVVNICQESEKEQNVALAKVDVKANETPATTHSCHEFDLNEGLAMDEFLQDCQPSFVRHLTSTSSALAGAVKATSTLSAPVAVSAAAKGAFIPPLNSVHKCDIGWKGSAATSAFRPAEPRHVPAKMHSTPPSNEVRNVNSFDLNVADQGTFEDDLPSSGQRNQEAHLDLNRDGKDAETEISTSISESSAQNLLTKRPVRDFDLNEQLDEVVQEQEVISTSVARRLNSLMPFGGPSECAPSGGIATWHLAGSTAFPVVSANVARTEQFFASSLNHPVSSRQTTSTTLGPPPLSSVVHSQTAPFFGGAQIPFPASFGYGAPSAGAESPFLVSKMVPSPIVSAGRSRPETSFVRPAFGTSMNDLRGGNSFYSWGRPHQNIYGGSSGPTIISYNDAVIGGREQLVNFDGSTSLEEQMRLYQQAAVPLTSLKRKDSDYFSGLKQSTWH